jgi:hypothetical protein
MSMTSDVRPAQGGPLWPRFGVRAAREPVLLLVFWLGLLVSASTGAATQRLAPGERWQFDADTWLQVHPDGDPVQLRHDPERGDLVLDADGVLWLESMSAAGAARLSADRIRLRDQATRPLLFRARGDLLLDAEHIDIVALDHPASWVESGGDLVFRSTNAVHGDAHFLALGSIRFETPDGGAAALYSPEDPILFAQGDVSVAAYTGQSIHVLAGGSITMTSVTVTTPADLANQNNVIRPANGNVFNGTDTIGSLATLTLSNGEDLVIDGQQRATIDLRAGVDWSTFAGGAPDNGWISSTVPPGTTQSAATGASISVGNLSTSNNNDAVVLLTNRYRPRAGVSGNISTGTISTSIATFADWRAGRIVIDSRNAVTTGSLSTNATDNPGGAGGDVLILAEDTIQTGGISTFGSSLDGVSRRGGGDVFIESRTGDVAFGQIVTGFFGNSANAVTEPAGDVRILATAGQLGTASPALLTRISNGNAASSIDAAGAIELVSGGAMTFPPNFVLDATARAGFVNGNGGDIEVRAGDGDLVITSVQTLVQSSTGPVQRSGHVTLEAPAGGITLGGFASPVVATSTSPDAAVVAGSGAVTIDAKGNISLNGTIQNATSIGTTGSSSAGTGAVLVHSAAGNIALTGVSNNVGARTISGDAGGVTLTAPAGTIATGTIESRSSASNAGGQAGRGGDVLIEGGGDISFGTVFTTGFGAASHAGAGHLEVTSAAGNLSYTGFSNTLSLGFSASAAIDNGRAGDIRLRAPAGSIALGILANLHSSNFASAPGATLRGAGDITLEAATGITNAPNLSIVADVLGTNGGAIVAGRAGDISVSTTVGDLVLDRLSAVTHTNSGDIAHRAGNLSATAGGRVQFNNGNALNASVQSSTGASSAPSGSISVEAGDDILVSGNILAFNSVGSGAAATTGDLLLHSASGDIQVNGSLETRVFGRSTAADAGTITLAADAGRIQVGGTLNSNVSANDASGQAGRGGDVELDAATGIQFGNFQTSGSAGSGGTHAGGGHVDMFSSSGDIVYSGVSGTLTTGFSAGALTTGPAGDLSLEAAGGSISLGSLSSLLATNFSTNPASSMGPGGNIRLVASGNILTSPTLLVSSEVYSEGSTTGGSGAVTITAGQGDLAFGRVSSFSRSGIGPAQAAGDISVRAVSGGLQLNSGPNVVGSVFANTGDTVGPSADITLRAGGLLNLGSAVQSTSQVGTNGGIAASSGAVELRSDAGNINAPGGVDVRVVGRSTAAAAGTIRVFALAGSIAVGQTLSNVQATNPAGVAGRGGDIQIRSALGLQFGTFQASGGVGAGGSHAGGGDIEIVSLAGGITYTGGSTQLFTGLAISQPMTTGPAGDVLLSAPAGSIALAPMNVLHAGNFSSDAAAALGPGGDVTISAGGGLSFAPGFDIFTESFSVGTLAGGGGDIAISAGTGDIVFGRLSSQSRAGLGPAPGSGDVVVRAFGGALQFTEGPAVNTGVFASAGNATGPAGLVNLRADGNLVAPSSINSSNEAVADGTMSLAGGAVTLRSDNGGITVGSITSRSSARIAASTAGLITLEAPNGPITVGTLLSNVIASQDGGQAGRGGDVQVLAAGNLQAGSIQTFGFAGPGGAHAGGGHITLESSAGDIVTTTSLVTGLLTSAPLTTGAAGNMTIEAPLGRISVGGSLFAYNAGTHPDSVPGDGGDVSLLAGLGFNSPAPFEIRSETFSQGAVGGRGGDVAVLAPQGGILLSQVFTHSRALAGDVAGSGSVNLVASNGLVEITGGTAISAYASTNGGSITAASGAITVSGRTGLAITGGVSNAASIGLGIGTALGTGPVQIESALGSIGIGSAFNRVTGRSAAGAAGGIAISAPLGAITSGSLDARSEALAAGGVAGAGGDIVLTGALAIQAGTIDSGAAAAGGGSAGVAGSIQVQTPGTIQAAVVRASSTGGAGAIAFDGQRVRLTSTVEALGLAGTGDITITHDGNGVVPFIVGDASENGSAGSLRTADAVIAPVQAFLYSKTENPNIRIISIDQAIAGLDATSDSPTTLGQPTQFTASVQEGNNVEFTWDFGDGNSGEGATVEHVYDATGDYTVEVTATNALNSASFELQVTVTNEAPIAVAGPDQSVGGRDTVTLDGSASSDPDGHLPLAFTWTQTSGPAVTLSDAAVAMPSFAPPRAGGELAFSLVVTDSRGLASTADEVEISVAPARYSVGGSVGGLLGNGLVLQNNGGDDLPIAADGPFEFDARLLDGSPYLVTILSQPQSPSQTCEVIGGGGSIDADDVADVQVSCRRLSATSLAVASPVRSGTPVSITASVTSDGVAPLDGQVEILADTGESCIDAGSAQNGAAADFVCQLTFATLGPRSLEARFTGSATHRDSTSDAVPLDVMRFADVAVTADDGNATSTAGEDAAWLIEVRNDGPDPSPATRVVVTPDASIRVPTWSCEAVGGAACPAPGGSGPIDATVDLPADGGLDYVLQGELAASLPPTIAVEAEAQVDAAAPSYVHDPTTSNNLARDVNDVPWIFRDSFEE